MLAWSRWVAATTVLTGAIVVTPLLLNTTIFQIAVTKNARENKEIRAAIHWQILIVPMLCLVGWTCAWLQTVPVGETMVGIVSRGSASAYADWIPGAIRQEVLAAEGSDQFHGDAADIAAGWHPVSICVDLTRSAQAGPAIFALVCLVVWDTRNVAERNATSESLRTEVVRGDGILGPLTLELAKRVTPSRDPEMQTALASKGIAEQVAAGRKSLTQLELPADVDPARDSTIQSRRAVYYLSVRPAGNPPADALLPGQSIDAILAARRHAINALMLCPLNDVARYQLVQTGFAADDSEATVAELLDQWTNSCEMIWSSVLML